jgi:hypothetical protein
MKPRRIDHVLTTLDRAVRWTGIAARVRADSLDEGHPRTRPLRWTPIVLIACSVALFASSLVWPSVFEVSLGVVVIGLLPVIQRLGPLGEPSIDDDEREAALRKDSFLFCLGLLACLNCLGQPVLAILSQLRNWQVGHTAIVAGTAFMMNACLFGSLPTLYASWWLGKLPAE